MRIYTNVKDIIEPVAEAGQVYIYVLENYPQENIKIGRTTNPKQRFRALSGSNNGGNIIKRIAISPMTYLYSLEHTCHDRFDRFRIKGTEYFHHIGFEEVVNYIDMLFNSDGFARCTELRKKMYSSTPNSIPAFLDKEPNNYEKEEEKSDAFYSEWSSHGSH